MGTIKVVSEATQDVFVSLKRLACDKCVYPGCNRSAKTVVAILKKKKDRPCFENSLILCEEHALLSQQGTIDEKTLITIRELLRTNRALDSISVGNNIPTRKEYLKKVTEAVLTSSTVRCVYVGPLPFHPEWYFDLKEGLTKMDSMDRAVSTALENSEVEVKMIIRNDLRYIEKIKSDVPQNLINELIQETCAKYEKLTNPLYNNKIIFWDLGFYHIPIILDKSCVFALRSQPRSPVEGGFFTEDIEKIKWEKATFDKLLEMHKDKERNSSNLKNFLNKLLE